MFFEGRRRYLVLSAKGLLDIERTGRQALEAYAGAKCGKDIVMIPEE